MSRPTIRHVALKAGVSPSQVSNAMRGKGRVDPQTVKRILDAAAELGYRPNRIAQSLRGESGSTLVCVLLDETMQRPTPLMSPAFWFATLYRFVQDLSAAGIQTVQLMIDEVDRVSSLPLDAIVVATTRVPLAELFTPPGVPLVTIEQVDDSRVAGLIRHDPGLWATTALDLLKASGCREAQVLHWQVEQRYLARTDAAAEKWAKENGISVSLQEVTTASDSRAVVAQIEQALRGHQNLGLYSLLGDSADVLTAIQSAGLKCPDDVKLVSLGDDRNDELLSPAVTAISLDAERTGSLAADVVMRVLQGESDLEVVGPMTIIERESTQAS